MTIQEHFVSARAAELMEKYHFTYAMAKQQAEEEFKSNIGISKRRREEEYEEESTNV